MTLHSMRMQIVEVSKKYAWGLLMPRCLAAFASSQNLSDWTQLDFSWA